MYSSTAAEPKQTPSSRHIPSQPKPLSALPKTHPRRCRSWFISGRSQPTPPQQLTLIPVPPIQPHTSSSKGTQNLPIPTARTERQAKPLCYVVKKVLFLGLVRGWCVPRRGGGGLAAWMLDAERGVGGVVEGNQFIFLVDGAALVWRDGGEWMARRPRWWRR